MPFTVSHIASVLPFHKRLRRLGLISAAAIGAMAPDLDLILPIRLTRAQTHGHLALLTFCLPVGLAAWTLFQALIKPALLEVVPDRVYARLCAEHLGPRLRGFKTWLYAASAVLFGALTHIIWDGFTHEDGRGVRMLPLLGERGPELGGSSWHLYRWLQHGSSVIGMAAVVMALWLWVRHGRRPNPPPKRCLSNRERLRWIAVCTLIPVLAVVVAIAQIHEHGWPRLYATPALTLFAVTGMRDAALAVVFTSALVRRRLLILGAGRAGV
jgi:Domain of unknown function (DUF4184)